MIQAKRAMHRRNQSRNLINGDTILPDIITDDLGDQAGINLLRTAVIGHIFCPNVVDCGLCSRAWLRLQFRCVQIFQIGQLSHHYIPAARIANTPGV
jgi:hypothetical protein